MTTMEKLFVQIFERKKWIIDQVKQQSILFDQYLASTLLIDGIPPPPWLFPQPHSSDPAELKKEELISGLLFPFPQVTAPYSISCNSVYDQPIFRSDTGQNLHFYDDACTVGRKSEKKGEALVQQEAVGTHGPALNGQTSLPLSPLAKFPHDCVMNHVPEPLPTPISKSPQDQRDDIVPDSYHSLEQSLSRIQRSKPRQKDLELRNSMKASKSSSSSQCSSGVSPIATTGCGNGHLPTVHANGYNCNSCSTGEGQFVDCRSTGVLSNLSNHGDMDYTYSVLESLCTDKSVKHRSSFPIAENYCDQVLEPSHSHNSCDLELVESINIDSNAIDSQGKEKKSRLCGRILRSQSKSRCHCANESSELPDTSAIGHDSRIFSEDAICVYSTDKLKESHGIQAAETDIFKIDRDGNLRMDRSYITGEKKIWHSQDSLKQLQQLNTLLQQEARPLNLSSLVSKVKQPVSTSSKKLTSAKLQNITNKEDISFSQVVILCRNGDGVNPKSCGENAEETRVVSAKSSEGFSDQFRSEMNTHNSNNEPEVPVSCMCNDRVVPVEPKQLDFGDSGESKSDLNEMTIIASEERMQDIASLGQNNSVDRGNGDTLELSLLPTQASVEETSEGNRILIEDIAVFGGEAFEVNRSPSSDLLMEKETSKDQFSTLDNKVSLLLDGENVTHHPPLDVEPSSLSRLKALVRMHSSVERSDKKSDTTKPSHLSSHESQLGYGAQVDHGLLAELEVREPTRSIMSCSIDLLLGDCSVKAHGSLPRSVDAYLPHDMNIDNIICQRVDPVEKCTSGPQGIGCSESDDQHISRSSVLSGHESSPHLGRPRPQSRSLSAGTGEAEFLNDSSTWKIATSQISIGNSQVRNLSRGKCHQEDVPSPEGVITADLGDVACSNASGYPVNLDEHNFENYALEGFKFSPMQQDEEVDPQPSLDKVGLAHNTSHPQVILLETANMTGLSMDMLDPRTYTANASKDQEHLKDDIDIGDAERSASSEGPVEPKLCHLKESLEISSHFASYPLPLEESTHEDQMIPSLEGFFMQAGGDDSSFAKSECSFEKFDIEDTLIERASLIEQLCKSTSMHTPSTLLSTASKLHEGSYSYQSVTDGLLKCTDFKSSQASEDDMISLFKGGVLRKEVGCDLDEKVDYLPVSGADRSRKPYASPVGKLWEKIHSNSGSSNNKASLNPELPCIREENEISDEATGASVEEMASAVKLCSAKRKPLDEITEDPNCPPVSELENHRCSIESVYTQFSFCGTNKRTNQKLGTHKISKKHTSKKRDSKVIQRKARVAKIPMKSLNRVTRSKMSLQKDSLGILGKEAKCGNIVCNVTSFIPLVHQKQAAVPLTGKRDVKVKALEAAEAAKRQEEKKEMERKMKKEALKVERAKMMQANIRQLELEKKKKEVERKRKEAEIAVRKRLREEEEKKEKERKRKRVEDPRLRQEEQKGKFCPKEDEIEIKIKTTLDDEKKDVHVKTSAENGAKTLSSETVLEDGSLIPETPRHCSDKLMETSFFTQDQGKSLQEGCNEAQSYEISPYQCSDDEDEDEDRHGDENLSKKFIPSWASKNHIALAISTQQSMDPDLILPSDSFCSINEVVLPRKLRPK
ncbi:hypothetical protein SAY87_010395 [Trapa incisa]|uniref:Inner centromere protein ARK-binding domain-containing protein n=1 Tax=Trapa incisa TaxID=236973 RepID=A0AAN7JIC7_9MYRT|nr:hypothetical protein SAY87_010395 [Trapa incisa]